MKRKCRFLSTVAVRIILLSVAAAINLNVLADSSGKCGDNLRWQLTDNGTLIITGEGAMKNYGADGTPWIPEDVKQVEINEGITHLGSNALCRSKIYQVALPASLRSIGNKAFAGSKNLSTVQIPYGVTEIGDKAFANCIGLVKIDLPGSLSVIGKQAFVNCRLLQTIYIPDRIHAIGEKAFEGCEALSNFKSLPETVTALNAGRFGLNPSAVRNYYADNKVETVVSQSHPAVSPSPMIQSKRENADVVAGVKYGLSDVDVQVPVRPQTNSNTFVLIIANENYASMPSVPFAINDGTSFKNYCMNILGIPERNITFTTDATIGNILGNLDYLKQIDDAYKGDMSVIFYYAGHGAPDDSTQKGYLIPTDAHAINERTCLPLDDLYKSLGELKAGSVKVFMDACFSGADRTNEMLAQGGRTVRIKPKSSGISGNVVVISATSDDQTAWHFKEQGHGLFTYFLLKKLKETGGDLSMGELFDYLQNEVPKMSIVVNRITQTPTSQNSAKVGNKWRLWEVKR